MSAPAELLTAAVADIVTAAALVSEAVDALDRDEVDTCDVIAARLALAEALPLLDVVAAGGFPEVET